MEPVDYAQITSAVFTALAALAALVAVRQGWLLWQRQRTAELHLQILLNASSGGTDVAVINVGGGVAKGAGLTVANTHGQLSTWLQDGFVWPGEKIVVHTTIPHEKDRTEALVGYRTLDESSWMVARKDLAKRMRRGPRGKVTSLDEEWHRRFPHLPLGDLPHGGYNIERGRMM